MITATVDQAAQAQRLSVGLGGALGIRTSLCTGSSHDLQNEVQTLLKAPPHVLVGTPQKLVDLFSMRILPTNSIRLLAIDECDQLIARNLSEHVIALSRLLPATVTVPVAGAPTSSPVVGRSGLPNAYDSPFSAPMSRFGSTGGPTSMQGGPMPAQSSGPPSMSTIDRQMAIFSCTVPQDVLGFATSLQLKEPVKVLVRRENTDGGASPSMRGLKQYYMYASRPASTPPLLEHVPLTSRKLNQVSCRGFEPGFEEQGTRRWSPGSVDLARMEARGAGGPLRRSHF